jgi:hypothetical protein
MTKTLNQFWLEVSQAHRMVANDNSKEITVARDGHEAKVSAVPFTGNEVAVAIIITPKVTKTQEAFIVPAGD